MDDGAPQVAHPQKLLQIFEFFWLVKALKSASAEHFSATKQVVSILKDGLTFQRLDAMFWAVGYRR